MKLNNHNQSQMPEIDSIQLFFMKLQTFSGSSKLVCVNKVKQAEELVIYIKDKFHVKDKVLLGRLESWFSLFMDRTSYSL